MKKLKKLKNAVNWFKVKWTVIYSAIGGAVWSLFCTVPAYAAYNPFEDVKGVIQTAVGAGGAFLVVFGLVQLGIQLKDGNQGGAQLHNSIWCIVGGVVIILAAAFIDSINF